jgi:putative cell wall-binding protein
VATGFDGPMPSYGYYLRIRHDDGTSASYVHINNDTPGTDDGLGGVEWAYAPGIEPGERVERGQWIAYVGDSGNAEGTVSHLHFELADPDLDDPCLADPSYLDKTRLNPYPSLVDARERNDFPPEPPAPDAFPVRRVAGASRVLTAHAISREAYEPGVRAVIVVPEGSYAEALVAAPLAGLLQAPILLSARDGLGRDGIDEVERLDAANAYVVGRTDQLGADVVDDLRDAGVRNVARIAEPDPYALSARMAEEIRSYREAPRLERVFLALGEHSDPARAWPDALSVGALAAVTKSPVLLTAPVSLPAVVREALEELAPSLVQVVGGTGAIGPDVAEAAADAAGADVERLSGSNRYATSVAVTGEAVREGLTSGDIWLATGHAFPDALAAGPAAASLGAPLLLIDGREPGGAPEPDGWLGANRHDLDQAAVVGGSSAITDAVRRHLAELLGG